MASNANVESAILLVGGFGTRLSPLTQSTPKPMLKVAGAPFTEHQIIKAREAGIKEIVLATSYLSEIFEPYFGNGENWGIDIRYAVEKEALGTGGAIRNAAQSLTRKGPVVIFNGDVLSSHSLEDQIKFHLENNADVSLYLTEVPDARAFGAVELDGDEITTFNEKMENPPTNIINAGCYIFNREVIDSIPANRVVSVERETFPELLHENARLLGFVDRSYWLDIGTPAALLKATKDLLTGVAQSDAFELLTQSSEYRIVDGALISNSAQIATGVKISAGSFIDHGAVLESGVVIEESVVLTGAVVGANAAIRTSFVAQECNIPAGFIVESGFLGFSSR